MKKLWWLAGSGVLVACATQPELRTVASAPAPPVAFLAAPARPLPPPIGPGPRYQVFGTRLVILPPRPILPGGTV